jgi:large subunit ribosomal protein L13
MTLTRSTKPFRSSPVETISLDAAGMHVGRLATRIATYLRGKHSATFTPNQAMRTKVVVSNASQVKFNATGMRLKQYRHYTGHPGGARYVSAAVLLAKDPAKVIRLAVERMLPRNRQRAVQMRRLTITK